MKRLLIFGAGGHGRELAWIARRCLPGSTIVEFVVDRREYWKRSVDGVTVRHFDDLEFDPASNFIAALGDPLQRRTAVSKMEIKFGAHTLVDPSTVCSERVMVSSGCVIMPACVLTTSVRIGQHTHLNIGCRISHDVTIEDFVTLSPAVSLAGNVHVESGAFIGIGASVINGSQMEPLVVGKGSMVAAGSCVTRSVPAGVMVAGVPAVIKRRIAEPGPDSAEISLNL
jgi:sugar O-acyltransferase (sialic acid O-acetyltransferase NeuD family)